jgi:Holliday junction resolvasome RuvABC endonuclease subunit
LSTGIDVFVREKGFSRFPHETQVLFKVMGIADPTAWQKCRAVYEEIAPSAVKKLLAGSEKASKEEVAVA